VTRWLLDTNVISELDRTKPSAEVIRWLKTQESPSLHVSVVSLAEIKQGIERLTDPLRRNRFDAWLDGTIRPLFEGRILDLSEEILVRWLFLGAELRRGGATLPSPDTLIAATAIYMQMNVVTRDVKHFSLCGVPVLNPWTGEEFHP
jgi:predicted nucleic acid-binding protein